MAKKKQVRVANQPSDSMVLFRGPAEIPPAAPNKWRMFRAVLDFPTISPAGTSNVTYGAVASQLDQLFKINDVVSGGGDYKVSTVLLYGYGTGGSSVDLSVQFRGKLTKGRLTVFDSGTTNYAAQCGVRLGSVDKSAVFSKADTTDNLWEATSVTGLERYAVSVVGKMLVT